MIACELLRLVLFFPLLDKRRFNDSDVTLILEETSFYLPLSKKCFKALLLVISGVLLTSFAF